MGYKIPNVVKEVYLPYESSDNQLSFDEYKEKYGIDIKQYVLEDGVIYAENTKFYIVMDGAVYPLQDYIDSQDRRIYGAITFRIGQNQELGINGFSGFIVNNVDKLLIYYEI